MAKRKIARLEKVVVDAAKKVKAAHERLRAEIVKAQKLAAKNPGKQGAPHKYFEALTRKTAKMFVALDDLKHAAEKK